MKKRILLLVPIVVLLSLCSTHDIQRPSSDLEDAIVKYWGYENTAIALAIRHAESLDGKWTFRFETTNIYHKPWVQEIPGIRVKFRKWGWNIISSCGDWQVFYPTALVNGYKGSPYELQHNIFTNAKYSAKVYRCYERQYPVMEDRISAYNRGHAWYWIKTIWVKAQAGTNVVWTPKKIKVFYNKKYVDLVMTNWHKNLIYERD